MLRPNRYYAEQAPWEDRVDVVVYRPPLPVVVHTVFEDGFEGEVDGTATAWGPRAVWCLFGHPDPELYGQYRVWVPAHRVRRRP